MTSPLNFPRYPREHLTRLISLESGDLSAVLAFALAAGLMSLATPIAVQALVNTIAFGVLLQPLVILMLTLFGCLALNSLLNGLQIFLVEMIQRRLFVRLVSQITRNLIDLSVAHPILQKGPELANYYFEVMTVQKTWTNLLLDGLGYGLQTLIGLVLLAFYHPALLAFDVLIVSILYLIFSVLGKKGVETAVAESEAKYDVAAWLQSLPANPLIIKWGHGSEWVWHRSDQLSERYLDRSHDHFKVVMKQQTAILALYAFANSSLLGLGGWMVIERQLTLGQLVAAELIVSAMLSGLTRLGKSVTSYYDLMAAMDKLSYLLDLPGERQTGEGLELTRNRLTLSLKGLTLTSDASDFTPPLTLPDVELAPGDKWIIQVPSPRQAGRILETIGGLRPAAAGSVRLNGVEAGVIKPSSLREHCALVLKPEWIQGTLLENLRLGRTHLDLEQIHVILRRVGLEATINRLPEGLQTMLQASGAPLDTSERWRLTLARALVEPPSWLMVGELLDAVESERVPELLDLLLDEKAAWTLILATARDSVIRAVGARGRVTRLSPPATR